MNVYLPGPARDLGVWAVYTRHGELMLGVVQRRSLDAEPPGYGVPYSYGSSSALGGSFHDKRNTVGLSQEDP